MLIIYSVLIRICLKISRAKDILTALNIDNAKIIPFKVSMSENRLEAIEVYNDIALQIEDAYKLGYKIAITAEGDAGIYSSSYYINEILAAKNIPVERIAGIPAFIACAASHNILVSKQRETIGIITHFSSVEELKFKTEEYDTLILMKTSQYEPVIKDAIKSLVNMTFHYFENSGVSEKEFYSTNREEILERKFPYFSLIIIKPLTAEARLSHSLTQRHCEDSVRSNPENTQTGYNIDCHGSKLPRNDAKMPNSENLTPLLVSKEKSRK